MGTLMIQTQFGASCTTGEFFQDIRIGVNSAILWWENDPSPVLGIYKHGCISTGLRAAIKFLVPLPGKQKFVSVFDPGLLLFDPEIERTLRRARQAKRRAELARMASDNNTFNWSHSDSDADTRTTSSDIGTFTMG
ncbi:hypothetical protein PIB30_086400 [Stylosanthes scabra]|uniref:Uncharacterized protein n=1 Tax=Stylosanthes scabra TaxID=79078 RepID=A0ABU6RTG3_9FABA|nr:hypothetical protein [Stylosanthes scabra]